MQAASGIAGLFGAVAGSSRYAPVNICDLVVGLNIDNAVTSVLYRRAVTGEGHVPCVDGSELARAFFTFAALVCAAMCSAFKCGSHDRWP